MATEPADWPDRARKAILGLLENEIAVAAIEIEARLADYRNHSLGLQYTIDPHVLGPALRRLETDGLIVRDEQPTRGRRRPIATFSLVARSGSRAVQDRAARKRLLMGRYLGWAQGTSDLRTGLTGPAMESAVARSLRERGTDRLPDL
jgi:DNA-binding PadR family transcriptional regulator